jgi:uncharacterized protein
MDDGGGLTPMDAARSPAPRLPGHTVGERQVVAVVHHPPRAPAAARGRPIARWPLSRAAVAHAGGGLMGDRTRAGRETLGRSYLDRPVTRMRRKDRRLDEAEWQDRLLTRAAFGHLAVVWEGQPLLHGNLFWYSGTAVYLHTAGVGKPRAVLEAAGTTRGCFSVAEHGRILPAGTPLDFSTEYASVILHGAARLVTDPAEKRTALEGLMAKYAPHLTRGIDHVPMPDSDIAQTSVLCLDIEERMGKHNIKPADEPAYDYPGESFIAAARAAGRVTIKANDLA